MLLCGFIGITATLGAIAQGGAIGNSVDTSGGSDDRVVYRDLDDHPVPDQQGAGLWVISRTLSERTRGSDDAGSEPREGIDDIGFRVTPTVSPTPTPALPDAVGIPVEPDHAGSEHVVAEFIYGYRSGSGDEALLQRFIDVVVPCESGWNPDADNGVGHRGLTQASKATWEAIMRPDVPYYPWVFDPIWHGVFAAQLSTYVENTAGSTFVGQWSTWNGC